jgi:hypothetical protein
MQVDPKRAVLQSLDHVAQNERIERHERRKTGLGLIALGIFSLPVPILGIPLIILGICMLCSSK